MKTIVLTLILLFPYLGNAQQPENFSNKSYLEKSIKQKKTANILLITGGAITAAGVVVALTGSNESNNPEDFFDGFTNVDRFLIISGVGLATAGVSIPFYAASKRNRRKYYEISPAPGLVRPNPGIQRSFVTAVIKVEF